VLALSRTPACAIILEPARKSLILNGEMSEWLKEHAWKAKRWNHVETHFPPPIQRLSIPNLSLGVFP
jgi:hypothetical protein